jgi:hypothetical protein
VSMYLNSSGGYCKAKKDPCHKDPCPQKPGTLLRVFIPAGAVINLLGLLEVSSPSGICLIVRVPLFNGDKNFGYLFDSIKQAGGSIEVVTE